MRVNDGLPGFWFLGHHGGGIEGGNIFLVMPSFHIFNIIYIKTGSLYPQATRWDGLVIVLHVHD